MGLVGLLLILFVSFDFSLICRSSLASEGGGLLILLFSYLTDFAVEAKLELVRSEFFCLCKETVQQPATVRVVCFLAAKLKNPSDRGLTFSQHFGYNVPVLDSSSLSGILQPAKSINLGGPESKAPGMGLFLFRC